MPRPQLTWRPASPVPPAAPHRAPTDPRPADPATRTRDDLARAPSGHARDGGDAGKVGGRARHGPGPPTALPTGRGIELVLLAFAAVLVTGALVLVEANQEQELTQSLLYVGAAYLALFTGAHVAVRRSRRTPTR